MTASKHITDFTDKEIRDEYCERFTIEEQLASFSDEEIEAEYQDRFDTAKQLREFDTDSIIGELDRRGEMPEAETELTDEIVDLIAKAAETDRYAARAYTLLGLTNLEARQRLIAGRMSEVAA